MDLNYKNNKIIYIKKSVKIVYKTTIILNWTYYIIFQKKMKNK